MKKIEMAESLADTCASAREGIRTRQYWVNHYMGLPKPMLIDVYVRAIQGGRIPAGTWTVIPLKEVPRPKSGRRL